MILKKRMISKLVGLILSISFCFQNPIVTVLSTTFLSADLIIYAATAPN
jgi:hypothetical protein